MTQTVIAPQESASALVAREIRAELGRQQMSNRRLAELIGRSAMWIHRRLSTGDTELTFDDAQLIAGALGVPVRQLLNPWLEHGASSNTAVIGALPAGNNTLSDDNVIRLEVVSRDGERPGVMRITRAAAA